MGYPVLYADGSMKLQSGDDSIDVIPETLCYSTEQIDRNGRLLFIGDTINDFGGGVVETDYDHPDYNPLQAFPPTKTTGDNTRLGNIIFQDGTVRIETLEMDYAYNISNGSRLCDVEYHSNVWAGIYPENSEQWTKKD